MRIAVRIERELLAELDNIARAEGLSRSALICRILTDDLWVRQFEAIRRKLIPPAQAKGIFTDEDVFRMLS